MNRTISAKAVALGLLVNTVCGFAAGIGVSLVFLVNLWLYLPPNATPEMAEAWAKQQALSTGFEILHLVGVLFPGIIGGYVAAQVAKSLELRHASIVGILAALVGFLLFPLHAWLGWSESGWSWSGAVYVLLSIPFSVLGGYLRVLQLTRSKIGEGSPWTR